MSSNNIYKTPEYKYKWVEDELSIDVGITAQELDDMLTSSVTLPAGAQGSTYTISTGATGAWGSSSGYFTASPYTSVSSSFTDDGSQLHVKGDTVIDGDLKVDGVSFKETIETINKRLSILVPDPEKLEHFEALKKAYEHYKTLEALCEIPKKENKE